MIGSASISSSNSSEILWLEMELGGEVVMTDTGEEADLCISGRILGGVVSSSAGKSSEVNDRPRWRSEAGRGKDGNGNGKPGLRVEGEKLKVNVRAKLDVSMYWLSQ